MFSICGRLIVSFFFALFTSCNTFADEHAKRWLAGDHHIHSWYSVGYDYEQDPPKPERGGDAVYQITTNNIMAKHYGLTWTVVTDHGGPNHSEVNRLWAYPELLTSRKALPDMVQFFGMEINSPGADHASLIIPYSDLERDQLADLERRFDRRESWPDDRSRNNPSIMLEALNYMSKQEYPPVVIANHPSRSMLIPGNYGLYDPAELRAWNDAAPNVAIGMAGAPGHQAAQLVKFARGAYRAQPTLGGFDQMTAILGGFWDSMLAEGRHFWITANSDSHIHYTQGGIDFWPGEYSKTYVYAESNPADILAALRGGRIFVTTGDLISELYVDVSTEQGSAMIGGSLIDNRYPLEVTVRIRLRDPEGNNPYGTDPSVHHVDLIKGSITGSVTDPKTDSHEAMVEKRFNRRHWRRDGELISMAHKLSIEGPTYFRVRGTNTQEKEPKPDPLEENPWEDLWFYSNPVFVR